MTKIQADLCIFYKKDDRGKLELVISIHVDDVFVVGRLEAL